MEEDVKEDWNSNISLLSLFYLEDGKVFKEEKPGVQSPDLADLIDTINDK